MESLKQVNISVEDLDEASKKISDEVILFFPWEFFAGRQQSVAKKIIEKITQRKVRELFGKPLPPARMRSPRMSRK